MGSNRTVIEPVGVSGAPQAGSWPGRDNIFPVTVGSQKKGKILIDWPSFIGGVLLGSCIGATCGIFMVCAGRGMKWVDQQIARELGKDRLDW